MVLRRHVEDFSCCITTTTRPMATKLGRVDTWFSTTTLTMATKPGREVTFKEELPSIKSHNPLIAFS